MSKIPAADRTLQLLMLMAEIGQPATAARLANQLGMPRSSCYQLLEALAQQGFAIHFPEDKKWGLGLAAWELGSAYKRHEPLERLATPVLSKLVTEIGQKANVVGHLGVLDGTDVLYLVEKRPARSLKLVTDVGVRLPAHLTASGRAMLSVLDPKQLKASYRGRELATRTEIGPKSYPELEEILKMEAAQGFSLEVDEVTMGYASVGVPIVDHLGHPMAGLAITLQSRVLEKLQLSLLTEVLIQSARDLSRKFGHHD